MAKLKTQATEASAHAFLDAVSNVERRADALRILEIMQEITGQPPKMWGSTMVGFGEYHYVYASGHEGDTFLTGFSPRKDALVLYFTAGLQERFATELQKLGKAKAAKGCLYVKKLADIDLAVLRAIIRANVAHLAALAKPRSQPLPAKKRRKKH
jgi:hypothetical protein